MDPITPKKRVILVVDDVRNNVELLGKILSPEYKVKVALTGILALKMLESEALPDLVLLDVMMPNIDGYLVCQKMKENPKTRDIPIIFVTAKNEDIDEAKGLELGAVDYLTKPVNPLIVRARVKAHLNQKAVQEALERQNQLLQENMKLRENVERMIRHDLKTPITALISIPEMLSRDKNLTPDQLEMLSITRKSGYRLLEMVNRSLDLYKMETGQYLVSSVPVEIVGLVTQIISELQSLAEKKKLSVSLLVDGKPAAENSLFVVEGEEFLYFSMLSNLIKNALEASPDGEAVEIRLLSGSTAVIQIHNFGEIPPEVRSRFRERYATYGKKGGTGLGVYSAALMVKTLDGEMNFQTSAEEGTTISIHLPQPEARTKRRERNHDTAPNVTYDVNRSKLVVLVVDDYSYMRKILMDILRQMGFVNILEAGNVQGALGLIANNPIDLILSDLMLPDGTGIEIVQALRSQPAGAKVPFILVTGNTVEETIRSALLAGTNDIVGKPFSPDTLRTKIESILETMQNLPDRGSIK